MSFDANPSPSAPANATERDLDLVLLGATGFVGRLTAEHLERHAPAELHIALAGRSRDRLEDVRAHLGKRAASWPLVVVDSADRPALEALAARSKTIASTVGPYARLGMPLVEACAEAGTDYCDLTGEVLFVRRTHDEVHERARRAGARIVHACGFDSVPSDLGVLLVAEAARTAGAGELTATTYAVSEVRGGISGGTIDSMRIQMKQARDDAEARKALADPFGLSPDRGNEPDVAGDGASRQNGKHRDGTLRHRRDSGSAATRVGLIARIENRVRAIRRGARRAGLGKDSETGHWTAPFVMAAFNTRIVRRSNALSDYAYGRRFTYREVIDVGSTRGAPLIAVAIALTTAGLAGGMAFAPTRKLLDRILPAPGEGPSEKTRARGNFTVRVRAETTSGRRFRARFSAHKDPGYDGTAVMLGESATALALTHDDPRAGGVLTPATALGDVLPDRLRARGFVLDAEEYS